MGFYGKAAAALAIAGLLITGCTSQDGGLSWDDANLLADDELPKYFNSGPVLAHTDHDEALTRLEHHQNVIALRAYSYTVSDNPAIHRPLTSLAGFVPSKVTPKTDPVPPPPLLGDPPDRWDWREQGAGLPPVRDQGMCGSCWAFSTVAALEAAVAVFDGDHVDLSEQHLIDCNTQGFGCGGGMYVHEMHQDPGAISEGDYPYRGNDGACASTGLPRPHKIESHATLPTGDIEAIKSAIYLYGSVSTAMAAGCGSIPGYSGGVYDSTECNNAMQDHAVSLVGYDDTVTHAQGSGVWIVRNSWGPSWGESGYMRIAYGVANLGTYMPNYVVYEPLDPTDTDEDGIIDIRDNCPNDVNADQLDADLDGDGDACDSTFDPIEHTVSLSDDDSRSIALGFAFPFFGESYSDVYVNSDGNLTFNQPDAESIARDEIRFLTGPPRIALIYADLNPSGAGSVTFLKEDPDTLTINYNGVPEYSRSGAGGSNSASVTLHSSGSITIHVSANSLTGTEPKCIVGVTRGGAGTSASETDISSAAPGPLSYEGASAVYEVFSGGEAFDLTDVTVTFSGTADSNMPPTASIDASVISGDAPLEVSFSGQGSDGDGSITSYHWDFSDGTQSAEQNVDKTFETDGEYPVTLTVTDNQGGRGTANVTIYVGCEPPPDGDSDSDSDDDRGPGLLPMGSDDTMFATCAVTGPRRGSAGDATKEAATVFLLVSLAILGMRRRN